MKTFEFLQKLSGRMIKTTFIAESAKYIRTWAKVYGIIICSPVTEKNGLSCV